MLNYRLVWHDMNGIARLLEAAYIFITGWKESRSLRQWNRMHIAITIGNNDILTIF
jgi:hypothetical protein